MLVSFRCLRRGLIGFHDLGELCAKSADGSEFFTAKRAASGANVDELNYGSEVVDFDAGFGFGVHVF